MSNSFDKQKYLETYAEALLARKQIKNLENFINNNLTSDYMKREANLYLTDQRDEFNAAFKAITLMAGSNEAAVSYNSGEKNELSKAANKLLNMQLKSHDHMMNLLANDIAVTILNDTIDIKNHEDPLYTENNSTYLQIKGIMLGKEEKEKPMLAVIRKNNSDVLLKTIKGSVNANEVTIGVDGKILPETEIAFSIKPVRESMDAFFDFTSTAEDTFNAIQIGNAHNLIKVDPVYLFNQISKDVLAAKKEGFEAEISDINLELISDIDNADFFIEQMDKYLDGNMEGMPVSARQNIHKMTSDILDAANDHKIKSAHIIKALTPLAQSNYISLVKEFTTVQHDMLNDGPTM